MNQTAMGVAHVQILQGPLIQQKKSNKTNQSGLQEETNNTSQKKIQKNFIRLLLIVSIISLSSFYFGYSLTYLETIPTFVLDQYYGSIMDSPVIHPILTGAMPIGAIFGSILANPIMKKFTRRNFLIVVNIAALLINLIIQITDIWVLLTCRIINGVLVGLYLGIVPIYIHQLSPHTVSGFFGSFTQIQHLLGNFFSYLIGLIFYLCGIQDGFLMRFQFQFTSLLIVLQMIFILVQFIPESPTSLIQQNKVQQAKDILKMFNQQSQIDNIIQQRIFQSGPTIPTPNQTNPNKQPHHNQQYNKIINQQSQRQQSIKQHLQNIQQTSQAQNQNEIQQLTWKLYFLSFQLPITQQLTGINFLVTQLTTITALYNQQLSHYTALIANIIQFIATLFSAYLIDRIGRRTIILSGNFIIAILNIIIGVLFYALHQWNWGPGFSLSLVFIMILNIVFGLTLGPVVWLYIPEIAPPKLVPFATATYWIGCSLTVIIAPIITTQMKTPYLIFIILGVYLLIMFVPNYYLVAETKDLTAEQINYKFKTK